MGESLSSSDNIGGEQTLPVPEMELPSGTLVLQQAPECPPVLADNDGRLLEYSIYEWYVKNLGGVDKNGAAHLNIMNWDNTTLGNTMKAGSEHRSRISSCTANLTKLMPLVEKIATVAQLGLLKGQKKDPSIDADFPTWTKEMKITAKHLSLMVDNFIKSVEEMKTNKSGNDKKLTCGALFTRFKRIQYVMPTKNQLNGLHKLLVKTIMYTIPSVIDDPTKQKKSNKNTNAAKSKSVKSKSSESTDRNSVSCDSRGNNIHINGDASNSNGGDYNF